MNQQSKVVRLKEVPIIFADLDKPDTTFDTPGYHKVTVPVDGIVKAEIKKVHAEFGSDEITGLKVHEKYGEMITFKTTIYAKEGKTRFPRQFDRNKMQLEEQPGQNDVVNLVLIAKQTKPKSQKKTYTSFYLDALQLVERNNVPNVPFDDLDDGEELFPEKTPVKKTTIDKEVLRKEKKESEIDLPWD